MRLGLDFTSFLHHIQPCHLSQLAHRWLTGMLLNPAAPNRRASTDRAPLGVDTTTLPFLRKTPAIPGYAASTFADLVCGARTNCVVATRSPSSPSARMVTLVCWSLEFKIATAVVNEISSKVNSAVWLVSGTNGMSASWSGCPAVTR